MSSADDPPANRQRWVPFAEALRILRTTDTTLRREIKAGRVQAERRRRNPDSATDMREVYEVLVSDPPAVSEPIESEHPPAATSEPPAATQALMEALAAERAERQQLSAENAALRERAGRAEERTIAAERRADAAERERAELQRRLDARRWWKWWG